MISWEQLSSHTAQHDGAPIQTNDDVISTATADDNQPETSTADSSFAELTEIQPLSKRKAGGQSKPRGKRADFGCKHITSTSEKTAALEKFKSRNQKTTRPKKKIAAVKKIAPPLVCESSDDHYADDGDEDNISYHAESSELSVRINRARNKRLCTRQIDIY